MRKDSIETDPFPVSIFHLPEVTRSAAQQVLAGYARRRRANCEQHERAAEQPHRIGMLGVNLSQTHSHRQFEFNPVARSSCPNHVRKCSGHRVQPLTRAIDRDCGVLGPWGDSQMQGKLCRP